MVRVAIHFFQCENSTYIHFSCQQSAELRIFEMKDSNQEKKNVEERKKKLKLNIENIRAGS